MSPLAETVFFVFGLIALGYVAGWTGYLKAEFGEALSQFAVGVALPLLLFRTMIHADFHGSAPWRFWAVYFTAVIITWTTGHLVMTRIFGRDGRIGIVGGVSAAFSNIVLLGVPFTLGVFGQPGFEILSLLVSVHLPTMLMASAILFQLFGRQGEERLHPVELLRDFLRRMLRNPLILGILGGLLWRLAGWPMPGLAGRFVNSLADVAAPVALFAMGLSLNRLGLSGNIRPALVLSALKLVLMPALVLALAWFAGLPPLNAKVAVAVAALPSGVNSYLIAVQFGAGQGLASNQILVATALAVVTMTAWLSVAEIVFR